MKGQLTAKPCRCAERMRCFLAPFSAKSSWCHSSNRLAGGKTRIGLKQLRVFQAFSTDTKEPHSAKANVCLPASEWAQLALLHHRSCLVQLPDGCHTVSDPQQLELECCCQERSQSRINGVRWPLNHVTWTSHGFLSHDFITWISKIVTNLSHSFVTWFHHTI